MRSAPHARNRLAPVAGVVGKRLLPEGVDLVADEAGDHASCLLASAQHSFAVARRQCFGYDRSMKEGPDIARIGALIGDPARANMLTALMDGRALTATELADVGGIAPCRRRARISPSCEAGPAERPAQAGAPPLFHASPDDGRRPKLLESIMGFAAGRGHLRHRPGPKEPALRKARHLLRPPGRRLRCSDAGQPDRQRARSMRSGTRWRLRARRKRADMHRLSMSAISNRRAVPLPAPVSTGASGGRIWRAASARRCFRSFLDKGWARRTAGSRSVIFSPGRRAAVSVALSAAACGRIASRNIGTNLTSPLRRAGDQPTMANASRTPVPF